MIYYYYYLENITMTRLWQKNFPSHKFDCGRQETDLESNWESVEESKEDARRKSLVILSEVADDLTECILEEEKIMKERQRIYC